jgi:hypothetical protein
MDYGMKISRAGYDVKTATEKQLSMSSKRKTFTVAAQGLAGVTIPSGHYRNRVEFTHNLGYVPAFAVFGQENGEGVFHQCPHTNAQFDIGYYFLYVWADSSKIYMEAQFGGGAPSALTYNFRYYVFNNQIE